MSHLSKLDFIIAGTLLGIAALLYILDLTIWKRVCKCGHLEFNHSFRDTTGEENYIAEVCDVKGCACTNCELRDQEKAA